VLPQIEPADGVEEAVHGFSCIRVEPAHEALVRRVRVGDQLEFSDADAATERHVRQHAESDHGLKRFDDVGLGHADPRSKLFCTPLKKQERTNPKKKRNMKQFNKNQYQNNKR